MSPNKETTRETTNTSNSKTADAITAELSGTDLGQLINEYKK